MITVTKKALTIIEGQDPTIKPEDPSKPGDTGNEDASNKPTTPTETKKETTNTSDTSASMTGLFTLLVLAGASVLGLRRKNNFE